MLLSETASDILLFCFSDSNRSNKHSSPKLITFWLFSLFPLLIAGPPGSVSQPLGHRISKKQGSSVNRRQEAQHEGLSRRARNVEPK